MDIFPALAALAVILIAAGLIVRSVPSEHTERSRTSARPENAAEAPPPDPWIEAEPIDPWVVEAEPMVVGVGEVLPGSRRGPVLAYIELPRRSPDPERLIQTEVLVPTGTAAGMWRAVRLVLIVLAFGVIAGAVVVGGVRVLVLVFSAG